MSQNSIGVRFLTVFGLGVLVGGAVTGFCMIVQEAWSRHRLVEQITLQTRERTEKAAAAAEEDPDSWPPREFLGECGWRYLRYDEEGSWSTGPVGSYQELGQTLTRLQREAADGGDPVANEIVLPVFPRVFEPDPDDHIYYDAIERSDMKPGDKVLVIGPGTGADAWAAWRKSRGKIYVVDINPMAIVNAKTTAQLAGFEIEPLVGDVTKTKLPPEFSSFDYVLWNMPFIQDGATDRSFLSQNYHDGDNGRIMEDFVALLPSLVKEEGTAILLNTPPAEDYIRYDGVTTEVDGICMLLVIPNAGRAPEPIEALQDTRSEP